MNVAQPTTMNCPDGQLLRDFNSGLICDVVAEEKVAEHLSCCTSCESFLAALDDTQDQVLRLLRQPDPQIDDDNSLEITRSITASHLESTKGSGPAEQDPDRDIPLRIDRYFVIRVLGSGGFGQVYLAKDPDQDRLVAIKVPHWSDVNSRAQREQFLREARTAAALSHPHLVPVYDCRELPDGRCIVVMKFIEGRTLQDLIRSRPVDARQAVELIATVADALQAAHARGIWHRDIKPANILLDQEDRPYLGDFGLAIHAVQQPYLKADLAGTFPYMSPEQIRGETSHLDGRADIWSLGVILYEMLTGERPFRGSDRKALSEEIQNRAPKAPRQFSESIGRGLERVCLRCLEKEPAGRFATAAELASSLRQCVRPAIKRKPIVMVLSLILVGLIATVVAFTDQPNLGGPAEVARVRELPLRAIAWPTLVESDFFHHDGSSGRIAVKSTAAMGCIETHRPPSSHFELSTTADFQTAFGIAGLTLGIHETSQTPSKFRCLIIYVSKDYPEPGMWLKIEDCEVGLNEIRHLAFRRRQQIANVQLDHVPHPNFSLGVEVNDGRVVRVNYNDQSLPTVVSQLRDLKIPHNTNCGVVVLSHVVFHSLNCKEL